ncbi:DUF6165 family protein [Marimonas lutisalis]|uniref:DUF6165 family protein n=1 Tax=Marimonas lutisalis TaxID=2545756 RepID=UPI0010F92643|nr:DUF6165 family protein [Marimonas lutisalis]
MVPVSAGELIDKLSILTIKLKRVRDRLQYANIRQQFDALDSIARDRLPPLDNLRSELDEVNVALWDLEDELRQLEADAEFGERFVAAARSVYRLNDRRASIKRQIDSATGSSIVDEKVYRTVMLD